MATPWFRLWSDMVNDPKWRTIAKVSGRSISDVIAVYLNVLTSASNAVKRGETQCNAEDVSSALDLEILHVESILKAMQGRVLDGARVLGWSKRQPEREGASTERVRAFRERKSNRETLHETAGETHGNTETPSEIDTDTEEIQRRREEPPNPRPDSDLPKAASSVGRAFKALANLPTSEAAIAIANLFHRRLTTPWSKKEIAAFKALGVIDPDELRRVEAYTLSERAKGNNGHHRRDLATFLNNFRGEVDRASSGASKTFTPTQDAPVRRHIPNMEEMREIQRQQVEASESALVTESNPMLDRAKRRMEAAKA